MTAITDALMIAFKAASAAIAPKPALRVSEWAERNIILSEESSAEPGPWRNARTPHLVEIMDQLSEDAPARMVVLMKSSQGGGTQVASNWLGSIIDSAKGPTAVVMPTDKSLSDWQSQKFDPIARSTPAIAAALFTRNNRASDNSQQRKRFTGGMLYFKTAGSTADLKSTSLRYAIADEVDEWEWSTLQGDPLGLLEVRLTSFHDHKLLAVSSPTLKDASRIEEAFDAGDQRRYHVPCPHCGEYQHLKWQSVRWSAPETRGELRWVRVAWYICEHCGVEIEEHHKPKMLAAGRWIAGNPGAPYPSYHFNALYSPIGLGRTWPELATEWLRAQGDSARMMRFINTRLGETWADRSRELKPNALQARAEPWPLGSIQPGCCVLTAGVDTQDDRIEIHILGHGRGDRTWTVDYHVLPGSPADSATWIAVASYLSRTYRSPSGQELSVEATAIDSGGHHTHAVYQFVRGRSARRCIAIKGSSSPGRIILGRPTKQDVNHRGQVVRGGVALYTVGSDTAKHLLYKRLADDAGKPPCERKVLFSDDLPSEYYDQLVSETYNPRRNRWELKKGKRNEALDTWVYALAASHHPELHLHKWRSADWARREAAIAALCSAQPNPVPAASEPQPSGEEPLPAQKRLSMAEMIAAAKNKVVGHGRR